MPSQKSHPHCQLPTLEDIQMDPRFRLLQLNRGNTGIPLPSRKYTTSCWKRWRRKPENDGRQEDSARQKFRYVDTPLVKAIRYGYLCEIQEPTVIANPVCWWV